MALSIPRMVTLQNSMLTRCYKVLYVLTAGAMLGWFILSRGHWLPVSIASTMRLNMWVTAPGDEALSDRLLAHQGDVCGSPSDYDYWWSEQWQYNGSTCVEVSSTCSSRNGACLRTADTYVKEGPGELFLATWTETSGGVAEGPTRFYVPQVNAFSVSFQYAFAVPHRPWLEMNQDVTRPPSDEEHRLSNEDTMTVFLDSRRDIAWIAKPGEPLEVPVPVLLQMAGYADHLTTPNPAWGKNVFPGARYPEGPIGLIGGLDVELLVHCHKWPKKDLGEGYSYWTGPTCYVIANAAAVWSERHASDNLGLQGVQYTYQAGIRIRGQMDGTWEYFDLNNCILSFAALVVLLQVPKAVMTWISCRALGHLSKIYRAAVFQHFYIEEHIAATAARILTHSISFRELEHTDGHGGLSNQGMHDAISYVTQPQKEALLPAHDVVVETQMGQTGKADEDTVLLFSDFAFNAICNPTYRNTSGSGSRLLRRIFGTSLDIVVQTLMFLFMDEEFAAEGDADSGKEASRMSVDHFISSAVSSDQVRFEHLLLLFNRGRRLSPLERWFTPTFVSEYLAQKHPELSEAETLQTPRSQEARAEEEMGDQGDAGLGMYDFKVSSRSLINRNSSLIKGFSEDLSHVRGSAGRLATTTDCRGSIPGEDFPGECPSSNPMRTPRLAPGETLAPSTSTAANHARPLCPEEGAEDRAEVAVSDIEVLGGWRASHQAAAQRHVAADHARPPGQEEEGGPAGAAAAERSGPHRPKVVTRPRGVHRAGPALCPGRPVHDSVAGAAGAEAAADGTRQPFGCRPPGSRGDDNQDDSDMLGYDSI